MASKRNPSRNSNHYINLSRSVAESHFRTEKTKVHKSTNFISNFLKNKWVLWAWYYVTSRFFSCRHKFLTYEGDEKGIYKFQSTNSKDSSIKVALVADWATDTKESIAIGKSVAGRGPDYSIHLGDTYFVGTPFEIENNFRPENENWPYCDAGSFALTGNHEMYSNGHSYFNRLLKWMGSPKGSGQKASYFCLENDYWRIIGLDTGYNSIGFPILELLFAKADLPSEILKWLKNDLKIQDDKRGLILLTHHQYASAFDKRYPSAAKQLFKIIGDNRNVLWFWGHEHRFAIYDKYSIPQGISAYGRCIGHGGMPTEILTKEQRGKKSERVKESNLILFDNRVRTDLEKEKVGHNGYAMLTIEKENLTVDYYDEEKLLVTEQWIYSATEKEIRSKGKITNHCSDPGFEIIKEDAIQ